VSAFLEVTAVVKAYRDGPRTIEVLKGVDLQVEAGELVAVMGPSGSGKSTLLHLLGALDGPDAGVIEIGGQALRRLHGSQLAEFRNRTIGFVFQFHQLLADFTALENVMMPGKIAARPSRETSERALALLGEVGLEDRLQHFPSQLSGGERQRVALCRALLLHPPLLLADEPTGNLDQANGEQVLTLLLELQRRYGTTTVVVTHNPDVARRCGRLLILEDGVLHA
jgi:lipoprotein-releasing system ATP-binding protein